jgi:pimeloyl-ACP methyl ester carboxylesterase
MKRYTKSIELLLLLLATSLSINCIDCAFVSNSNIKSSITLEENEIARKLSSGRSIDNSNRRSPHQFTSVLMLNENEESSLNNDISTLDIVLMSVGDLRVDDHIGLINAISNTKNSKYNYKNMVLPVVVLTNDILSNIPGIVAHTIDIANILSDALYDINESLTSTINPTMKLHYLSGSTVQKSLRQLVLTIQQQQNESMNIRIHVCDLGDADNNIGYNPYSQLTKDNGSSENDDEWEIVSWTPSLRTQPWQDISSTFTDKYPTYETMYTKSVQPIEPISLVGMKINDDNVMNIKDFQYLPSKNDLLAHFQSVLSLEADRCQAEKSTGIYSTHWGGLKSESSKGSKVLETVTSYVRDYKENDIQWMNSNQQQNLLVSSNPRSLEHASMKWQLIDNHWMAGECITRYLAAPILFGTISLRRLWYIANENSNSLLDDKSIFFPSSSIKQMVESSEWHKLLAAKYIRTDPAYNNSLLLAPAASLDIPQTTYKYWRYQGFLCRYAITNFNAGKKSLMDKKIDRPNNNGILLVHGFGASGAQWNKVMYEIGTCINETNDSISQQGLAPDLIGFGHSEKPGISYTGYMWDSQITDFCKEIAITKHQWDTFVIGGNSIGGFTSLSAAASDTASISGNEVSSNGSPGTLRCSGLVLMNSAGPIKTAEEIQIEMDAATTKNSLSSIAEQTINGQLKACSPPPRPIARAFGNGLLSYLRPSIQSICKNLYPTNPDAVDDILCEGILRDSLDPGAVYVMMAGAKLPTPRTANELLDAQFGSSSSSRRRRRITTSSSTSGTSSTTVSESVFTGPVLIAQGVLDPLNDAMDRMNRFASLREGITPDPIQAGHCPHDEQPGLVAKSIVTWMNTKPWGMITTTKNNQIQGSVVSSAMVK